MNREMRRLQEREERLAKKQDGSSKAQRKANALTRSQPVAEKKSFFARLKQYLHEVRLELKKVTWPTREQMIAFTSVTLITTTILTAVIFGLDIVMKEFVLKLVELRS
ncbi:MAG TPA: preprotein translocase subunit SecE [Acidimicrobiia bacterium]